MTVNIGESEGDESEETGGFKIGFAHWNTSDFSPCSQTCAGGIQTRAVFCEQVFIVVINNQRSWCYQIIRPCVLHINGKETMLSYDDEYKDKDEKKDKPQEEFVDIYRLKYLILEK